MRGNITRRGKSSWRIKFDVGTDPESGKRLISYSVHGTRKQAEPELAKRLNEFAEGRYVAPTVETVEIYARHWLENIAPASRAAITVERYQTLLRAHIIPGLGSIELQKLDGSVIDRFYATRREKGLASLTLHHITRCFGKCWRPTSRQRGSRGRPWPISRPHQRRSAETRSRC